MLLLRVVLAVVAIESLAWGLFIVLRPQALFALSGMPARNDAYFWQLRLPKDAPEPPADAPPEAPPAPFIPPPRDAGLWHLLGLLILTHPIFLGLALWKPNPWGMLVLVPLVGRTLLAGVWLWALGTTSTFPAERVPFEDRGTLVLLALHEAVVAGLLLGCVVLLALRDRRTSTGSAGALAVQ